MIIILARVLNFKVSQGSFIRVRRLSLSFPWDIASESDEWTWTLCFDCYQHSCGFEGKLAPLNVKTVTLTMRRWRRKAVRESLQPRIIDVNKSVLRERNKFRKVMRQSYDRDSHLNGTIYSQCFIACYHIWRKNVFIKIVLLCSTK